MDLEIWDWCYHCNRKHYGWTNSPSPRCRREPLTNHSENNHFFKQIRTEEGDNPDLVDENGKLIEIGIPLFSVEKCVVCGLTKKVKKAWR